MPQLWSLSIVIIVSFVDMGVKGVLNAKKTVIAHMTNTPEAVRWALDQGANGIELDLNFYPQGDLKEIKHGGLCDCSCLCLHGKICGRDHVCNAIWTDSGSHCGARSDPLTMFKFLANDNIKSRLALLYIDGKLNNEMIKYYEAGQSVVRQLNEHLLSSGFKGQILLSVPKIIYIDYLHGALAEAQNSDYESQYFYTVDGEENEYDKVYYGLQQLGTDNIFYATGRSVCFDGNFYTAVSKSVDRGHFAGVGIWTLDNESSMRNYAVAYSVSSIITNVPATAKKIFGAKNLAQVGEALKSKIVPKSNADNSWSCHCNYHRGGCTIARAPPPGKSCFCKYQGFWTCTGWNTNCKNSSDHYCQHPLPPTKESCKYGGGNCGGY